MIAGALVLARGIRGSAEASATRRPATPRTRSCGSSTLSGSVPIAAEHAGWAVVATVARTMPQAPRRCPPPAQAGTPGPPPTVGQATPGWTRGAGCSAPPSSTRVRRPSIWRRCRRPFCPVSVRCRDAGGYGCRTQSRTAAGRLGIIPTRPAAAEREPRECVTPGPSSAASPDSTARTQR